jgi:hypothetical protein
MPRFEAIRDRLPSLYRPEADDEGLLTILLRAVGREMEALDVAAAGVLQSHWFDHADRALYDAYYLRSRQVLGRPNPNPTQPDDRKEMEAFPYIHDLAYLAALLPLAPRQQPPALREVVEAYRLRIERTLELYQNGLGTPGALRRMVELELPVDPGAPEENRDLPFSVEECARLDATLYAVETRGKPEGVVGPLMRWRIENGGQVPAAPTVYVQGVAPKEGESDATIQPVIELAAAGAQQVRLGVAYTGTLAAEQTLRLRPAYRSWLGSAEGVQHAESRPEEDAPADPAAPGPWQPVAAGPRGSVVAFRQTQDRRLWAAVEQGADQGVWHTADGTTWTRLAGALVPHCLAESRQELWIGTDTGLRRLPLYPTGDLELNPAADLDGLEVVALHQAADGAWWAGTSAGLFRAEPPQEKDGPAGKFAPFVLGDAEDTAGAVYAVHQDRSGTLSFGTEWGLARYQPATGHWYWYEGRESSEQARDWQRFHPDLKGEVRNSPLKDGRSRAWLPPVRSVLRGREASLWLGTEAGIARYVAYPVRGLTYQTRLEAFPDLATGAVHQVCEDERGQVWFCTEEGLFRYDGRDWWQFQKEQAAWKHLGRADTLPGSRREDGRGAWRYDRQQMAWQLWNPGAARWENRKPATRGLKEPAVRTVAWTDGVAVDLGSGVGSEFSASPDVPAGLVMRFKPDDGRAVEGGLAPDAGRGLAAVPRLPSGPSLWRYLRLEEGQALPDRGPFWTREGRRLGPPADHPLGEEGRLEPAGGDAEDEAVFAYLPAARVWFAWQAGERLSALVRLRAPGGKPVEPAVLDRVWEGMQSVRPAGVRLALAVDDRIVRGGKDG